MYKQFRIVLIYACVLCGLPATPAQAAATSTPITGATTTATTTKAISISPTIATTTTTTIMSLAATEKRVREYFADIPVMIEIARCESKFRQFTDSGKVLRGGSGGMMVGIFQFFESIHAKAATNLGFDLFTVEGNLSYARHLYTKSGSNPWASCVPVVVSTPALVTPIAIVQLSAKNEKLKIELLKQVIVLLQELLKLELAKGN